MRITRVVAVYLKSTYIHTELFLKKLVGAATAQSSTHTKILLGGSKGIIIFVTERCNYMQKQTKNMAKALVIVLTALVMAGSLQSCASQKCDCPTFGGHRLKH